MFTPRKSKCVMCIIVDLIIKDVSLHHTFFLVTTYIINSITYCMNALYEYPVPRISPVFSSAMAVG